MPHKKACCSISRQVISDEKIPQYHNQNIEIAPEKHMEDMIYIQGGIFSMGTNDAEGYPADGEGPVREIEVSSFYIDQYAVTNRQFKSFIDATGYQTDAEQYGWSFVFHHFVSEDTLAKVNQYVQGTPWWLVVEGAAWNHPEGPDSSIVKRMDHPVVHISWNDAKAYCNWANKRLPTEAEWEFAARGGLHQQTYPWGNEFMPNGTHYCNTWQGKFPNENEGTDGYLGTAPVKTYPSNGYGLYQMVGNVWEWCSDWFSNQSNRLQEKKDPAGPLRGESKVMRGGSYLCHRSYCNRYRVAARTSNTTDSSTGNLGFRCVTDVS